MVRENESPKSGWKLAQIGSIDCLNLRVYLKGQMKSYSLETTLLERRLLKLKDDVMKKDLRHL